MRLGRLRLVWVALALLAAFVIFIQCVADVGGGSDPVRQPGSVVPFDEDSRDYGSLPYGA